MPRNRALLSFRAVNSLKYVFGANQPAWLTELRPADISVSPSTAVTLNGSVWGSSGSFCAVTVTGGSDTVTGGCCAAASAGASAQATATQNSVLHIVEFS